MFKAHYRRIERCYKPVYKCLRYLLIIQSGQSFKMMFYIVIIITVCLLLEKGGGVGLLLILTQIALALGMIHSLAIIVMLYMYFIWICFVYLFVKFNQSCQFLHIFILFSHRIFNFLEKVIKFNENHFQFRAMTNVKPKVGPGRPRPGVRFY